MIKGASRMLISYAVTRAERRARHLSSLRDALDRRRPGIVGLFALGGLSPLQCGRLDTVSSTGAFRTWSLAFGVLPSGFPMQDDDDRLLGMQEPFHEIHHMDPQ
jgi:hypothetical protein